MRSLTAEPVTPCPSCSGLDLTFGSANSPSPAPGGVMVLSWAGEHLAQDTSLGPRCVPAVERSLKSEMKLMRAESKSGVEVES